MKKSILIIGAIIVSTGLMAINFFNKSESKEVKSPWQEAVVIKLENNLAKQLGLKKKPAFFFDMGPRFRPIKKSFINNVKGIDDFLTAEELKNIDYYGDIDIILIENEVRSEKRSDGTDPVFSDEQITFLQSMPYSSNFVIQADFQEKVPGTDGTFQLNFNYASPHLTVVPEKQAEYDLGNGAFYEYLRKKAKKEIDNVDYDELFPAKLYFTVSMEGEITNIKLMKSSRHPELDEKMIELMQDLPGQWIPAKNEDGEKVAQELVLSFGMIGC